MSAPFYDDLIFPPRLAYTSSGGPSFSTTVIGTASGRESRNRNWIAPLRKYNATKPAMTVSEYEELVRHFASAGGKHAGFPFEDPLDYSSHPLSLDPTSTDQVIGVGDGLQTEFQLIKQYAFASQQYVRAIKKPRHGTVAVAVEGVNLSEFDFEVDYSTGIVSFNSAPVGEITAGYEFFVPVRYDSDDFLARIDDIDAIVVDIPLVEIRL